MRNNDCFKAPDIFIQICLKKARSVAGYLEGKG